MARRIKVARCGRDTGANANQLEIYGWRLQQWCRVRRGRAFTNLIAEPDAGEQAVTEAVNDTLQAIAASLLMEQVVEPRFEFRPKKPGTPRHQISQQPGEEWAVTALRSRHT